MNCSFIYSKLFMHLTFSVNSRQAYSFLFGWLLLACSCGSTSSGKNDGLAYIHPEIGGVGRLLQPTRPTIQQPNQMMRMTPIREDFLDDQISSFPLLIPSHRLGEVFFMLPNTDSIIGEGSWNKKVSYDQENEVCHPWHYSTYLLDNQMTVEFTPGKKTGIFRFSAPKGTAINLLFSSYSAGKNSWHFLNDSTVEAVQDYAVDSGHQTIPVFLYGRYNMPAESGTIIDGKVVRKDQIDGANVKVFSRFSPKTKQPVQFRYAVSYISLDQAKKNFDEELGGGLNFDGLEAQAKDAWSKVINQIEVEGGTEAEKRSFYTALYRCYERMVDITEDGKYYSGYDNQVHQDKRPFYVDDWTWDTYLAHHPLRAILRPQQEEDMLQSYVRMYEQDGWMPTFPVVFGDHACMNAFHSSVMFLDDYRKGLRNFDVAKAYEGMLKNATEATMLPWRNGPKTELDDFYYEHGYFPALKPGEKETVTRVHPFEKRQAVAVTLGGSYDDWSVGQMAGELGKAEDANVFAKRALNYKNLWNPERQFFLPKDDKGNWIQIDPKFDGGMGGREYYDENNGWTYLWQVQEDLPGLIELMGGRKGFENRLDQLFREGLDRSKYQFWAKFPDATGLVGQYSMGNEPSFFIPYLYNFTDSPWKTQNKIRLLLHTWFGDNVFGIPGDEDGGGMSAFVVFSSLGFYPVLPGKPVYAIGSPLFTKSTIHLTNGKNFTVIADNCSDKNKYIQSASLNGEPLNNPFFTHDKIMAGGTLQLKMGDKPNKKWGTLH